MLDEGSDCINLGAVCDETICRRKASRDCCSETAEPCGSRGGGSGRQLVNNVQVMYIRSLG